MINDVWSSTDEFIGAPAFFPEDWTYTGSGLLKVTDFLVPGEQYDIYDNGILIGSSSAVAEWDTYEGDPFASPPYTFDPETGWEDDHFSHFSIMLGDGSHDITIFESVTADGFADSDVALEIAPEPGSIFLFGTGLAGLAGLIRRKLAK